MPARARGNPSFFVLTIENETRRKAVAKRIGSLVKGESGGVLVPLGGWRYALSRPALLQLRVLYPGEALGDWLARLKGVTLVRRMGADKVLPIYMTRDPADPALSRIPPARRRGRAKKAPSPARAAELPWNLVAVNAEPAWHYHEANARRPLSAIRVAHLDTGFREHPAFGAWDAGYANAVVLARLGVNYVDGGLPRDPLGYPGHPGHGTRTMSVLAAVDGMKGMAPGASVVPYRVTDTVVINFLEDDVQIGRAIRHAIDDNGCQVVSISLGDPCLPGRDNGAAVDYAYEQGVIVVAAAGNVTSEVTFPGRHARTIGVGGVSPDRRPWAGGSRGHRVDLCGPADDVFRATWDDDGRGNHAPGYGTGDGTSYATVHVSGTAALWLSLWGDELDRLYPEPWQRVEAFRHVIRSTARPTEPWDTHLFGAGILDAAAALAAPLPPAEDLVCIDDVAVDDIA